MGLRPCFLTASSEARTRAAAPSESGEALAAVTVPSFLKEERSVRVLDSLNCGWSVTDYSQSSRLVNSLRWRLTFLGSSSTETVTGGFPRP